MENNEIWRNFLIVSKGIGIELRSASWADMSERLENP